MGSPATARSPRHLASRTSSLTPRRLQTAARLRLRAGAKATVNTDEHEGSKPSALGAVVGMQQSLTWVHEVAIRSRIERHLRTGMLQSVMSEEASDGHRHPASGGILAGAPDRSRRRRTPAGPGPRPSSSDVTAASATTAAAWRAAAAPGGIGTAP